MCLRGAGVSADQGSWDKLLSGLCEVIIFGGRDSAESGELIGTSPKRQLSR